MTRYGLGCLLGVWLSASACLPADTRPAPGSVELTASGSEATRVGFTASDGWQIRLDRFVAALGSVDLDSDPNADEGIETCSAYSEARYDRVFDFVAVEQPEKVGLVYGRGVCSVEYRFRSPSSDTLVGAGASAEDVARMRVQQTDEYTDNEQARISLIVAGSAVRGEHEKRFEWMFRHQYEMDRCAGSSPEDPYVSVHQLADRDPIELNIEVRAEELFRTDNDDAASTQFEAYALADADADGAITMAELDAAAVTFGTWQEQPIADDDFHDEPREPPKTLLEALYIWLLPRVSRISGGGPCRAERRGR